MTYFKGIFCLFLLFASGTVLCDRQDIHHMMYESFTGGALCFRIFNGTNQFGCTTSESGSTGVVHIVNNDSDIQWLLDEAKSAPYMAVITPSLFNKKTMDQLVDSGKISGVLLAVDPAQTRPDAMSPEVTCPNRYSSLEDSCDDSAPWNPLGLGFLRRDWPVALYLSRDPTVLKSIRECFTKFNLPLETQTERSLCSLQMKGRMFGAVDTPTCMRRNELVNSFSRVGFCDPMGDANIFSQLFPRSPYKSLNGSTVLVTARMDVAGMFDQVAPGAMTTVTGLVTLLTTAHLLSRLLPQQKTSFNFFLILWIVLGYCGLWAAPKEYHHFAAKNVIFALLNGEAQDYIGSSRMVYDMQQGGFLSSMSPLKMEHLDQVIDLHQLDGTRTLHCHCFQSYITTCSSLSMALGLEYALTDLNKERGCTKVIPSADESLNTIDLLAKTGEKFGVSVEGSCSSGRLPPSSLHSFLKANISLPGVILTNHGSQYTNKYYQGLLDDAVHVNFKYANGSQIQSTSLQSSLASVAQSLALALAQLVDSSTTWPADITTDNTASLVDKLLYCYLESRNCDVFKNVYGPVPGEGPLSLYVGVNRAPNLITRLTFLTMANLTGTPTNLTEDKCKTSPEMVDYNYVWVAQSGVCIQTGLISTSALSPAFDIDNYNWTSGEYSTWTESVWAELGLRMFLKPAFSQELYTLISGLVVLFLSFASVYWINRNTDRLFFTPAGHFPTDECNRC